MKTIEKDEAMNSLFFSIYNSDITKKQFETLESELHKKEWGYDISGFDYWSKEDSGQWYIWSDTFKEGEEDEAYESIKDILDIAGLIPN